jgi:phosphatidylserine/phosphatidylglycerophosphate/cardiolipin synthase-like enzyme
MFSLLKRSKTPPDDLLTSRLYDENSFYHGFIKDLKQCKQEVIIESPYMTCRRVDQLAPVLKKLVKNGVKVRINTRYPGHHEKLLRIQAYTATKTLKNIGARVWYYNDYHHRKIAVIDGRILWEGSLNILSQCRSREIMRRIESEKLTKQMIGFLRLKRLY